MDINTGVFFGLAAMVSWGLSDFFVVRPVHEAGINRTFLWNQVTGLIILPVALLLWGHFTPVTLESFALIACAGICGIIGSLAFYKGMKVGNVSVITPIVAAWSVVTVIASVIVFGESLTVMQTAGVALAICGTSLVSLKIIDIRKARIAELAKGAGFAVIALFAFGLQFVFLDALSHNLDWIETIFLTRLFVVVVSATAFSVIGRESLKIPQNVYPSIVMIALFEVIGFLAYGQGIAMQQSSIIAPVSATHPVVTIILAIILLREKLEPNQIIGIISVICGIVLLSH